MINSSGKSSRSEMTTAVTEAPVSNQKFVRGLGLLDSTMLVAGSMIGSGIFIVSADIGRLVGSPGWLLVVWAVTGVLTIVAALSYGELAAMMPRAGGQYVYLREALQSAVGISLWLDAVPRDTDRNNCRSRSGVRTISRRAY